MTLFTARMPHSRETLRRFTRLQYNTFEFGGKAILLLISLALIVFGAGQMLADGTILGIAALLVGCLVLTNLNAKADGIADDVAKAMGGKYPTLEYTFCESSFSFGEGDEKKEIPYASLFRILEDGEYLYLFTSKASGYMVLAASVTAADGSADACGALKARIASAASLSWTRPLSIWSFSLRDLLALKKAKKGR